MLDPYMMFETVRQWDKWLEEHHESSTEAWVTFPTKGNPHPSITRGQAVISALKFGWIDGKANSAGLPDGWWSQRFTPRRPSSRWSLINREAVEKLIAKGEMRPAGMLQVGLARQSGRWDAAYPPPSLVTIPPDLHAELEQDPGAKSAFEALSAGNRYRILNSLHNARREDTRRRRLQRHLSEIRAATGRVTT